MALGRAPYIDQSQSLNIYLRDPNLQKMSSMHFYGWKNGLKTGMYYLRSTAAADAIKFTLDVESLLKEAGLDIKKQTKINMFNVNPNGNSDEKENRKQELEEEEEKLLKKVKPNEDDPEANIACPLRRPGMADDEICYSCGS